ncbi:hypothetical protein C8F01DRAFT_1141781 [Mycena amicta]|nr:hypothetical protein C8F01DRAFT_1141781 [Mycena amicta]
MNVERDFDLFEVAFEEFNTDQNISDHLSNNLNLDSSTTVTDRPIQHNYSGNPSEKPTRVKLVQYQANVNAVLLTNGLKFALLPSTHASSLPSFQPYYHRPMTVSLQSKTHWRAALNVHLLVGKLFDNGCWAENQHGTRRTVTTSTTRYEVHVRTFRQPRGCNCLSLRCCCW